MRNSLENHILSILALDKLILLLLLLPRSVCYSIRIVVVNISVTAYIPFWLLLICRFTS